MFSQSYRCRSVIGFTILLPGTGTNGSAGKRFAWSRHPVSAGVSYQNRLHKRAAISVPKKDRRPTSQVIMKAIWNDKVLAESEDTIAVEGNEYFPSDSI